MEEVKIEFKGNKSVALLGNNEIGVCEFKDSDEGWVIFHTEVNPNYKGQGIAKRLLDAIVNEARNRKIKIIPECSYAKKVMNRNNDYKDVI
jgi:hypothetical protein